MTRSFSCRMALGALTVSALAAVGSVRAGGGEDADGYIRPRGLEVRIFGIAGLVASRPEFMREALAGEEGTAGDTRFGGESEEGDRGYGGTDDVIAFVRATDPAAFDDENVAKTFPLGNGRLFLRAAPDLQRRVAARLEGLERRVLSIATLDVVALQGEATLADQRDLASSVARGALTPLSGARACGTGGRITARAGSEHSYLAGSATKVAEGAKAFDPIVDVAKEGLAFAARLDVVTSERIVVDLSAWWSKPSTPVRVELAPQGDGVESIDVETRRFDGVVELVPGEWKLLPASGDIRFVVRATVRPYDLPIPLAPVLASCDPVADLGPVALRTRSALDLFTRTFWLTPRPGIFHLAVSGWNPPARKTDREVTGCFPSDLIIETIKMSVDLTRWADPGLTMDLKNGMLLVSGDEAHDRAIAEFVDALRRQFVRSIDLRATVVTMPLVSLPEYWSALGDGEALLADGGRALLARPGAAVVDRGAHHVRSGQRDASSGGTQHLYVADYDVGIAEKSAIGNPIVRAVLDGLTSDLDVDEVAGGTAVRLTLRLERGVWRGSRVAPTSHGDIECPTLGVSAVRGEIVIPLGATRIVGAVVEGETVTLTLFGATGR